MIRTILIDDESLIRDFLKNSIEWEKFGYEIIAEAEDGEDALDKIEHFKPDLIVVDINIPFISGIELAKIVNERFPSTKIFILTGYNDFEYARKAVNVGVSHFFLKPLDIEEFSNALIKAYKDINSKKEQNDFIQNLLKDYTSINSLNQKEFILSLINKKSDEKEIHTYFNKFEMPLKDRALFCVIYELDNFLVLFPSLDDQELYLFAVANTVTDIFSQHFHNVSVFPFDKNRIVIFMNIDNNISHFETFVHLCIKEESEILNKYIKCTATIGVSNVVNGFKYLQVSLQQAIAAIENKFVYGQNTQYFYNEADIVVPSNNTKPQFTHKQNLLTFLRLHDNTNSIKVIEDEFQRCRQLHVSKDTYFLISSEIIGTIHEFINEICLSAEHPINLSMEKIISLETVDEICHAITSYIDCIISLVKLELKTKSETTDIVNKAIAYIENNYNRNWLTPEKVALSLFVSPNYLSKIFKAKINCSLIQYIIDKRMTFAKEYMDKNPSCQISEIAYKSGYSDPFYFSKSFKKYFGISPTKYLENKLV